MGNELDLITLFLKRFEHAPLTASACGSDTRLAQEDLIEPCKRLARRTMLAARSKRGQSAAPPLKFPLALLGEGILARLGLLPCQSERREGGAALFLLVPLRLRLLLFLVAAHLTLGHGVPPVLPCPPSRGGGRIEAPPAHGFKRGLASVASAVGRMLCGSPDIGPVGQPAVSSAPRLHLEYFTGLRNASMLDSFPAS